MPYIVTRSDPTEPPITVPDGSINVADTSVTLVGRNYPNYGQALADNFVHMVENFASPTPPTSPVTGQVWYDSTDNNLIPGVKRVGKLKVYDGIQWRSINNVYTSTNIVAQNEIGDILVDVTATNAIKVYTTSGWQVPFFEFTASTITSLPTLTTATTNSKLMVSQSGALYQITKENFLGDDAVANVLGYGAVGNGTADDTVAIQTAINSGKTVYLPPGKTFRVTSNLTGFTNFQQFGGPGVLKFIGNTGIVVNGGVVGVELDVTFNSSAHTGTAVTINNANRTRIKRILGIDVFNVLYVTKANVTTLDWCWATARGKGITWYGNDTTRSDILHINFAVIAPGTGQYGLDWDGNCHSLEVKYLGLVGGAGTVIRNTAGVSTYPAIGRFGHIEQDYSTGIGIDIQAGLDYDFNMPYVLGSTSDGFKIAATINSYEVRIHGGKSVGNGGYGINNLGGVLLYAASTALYSNTSGEVNGTNVWTISPRFVVDNTAYWTKIGGNPYFVFDTNDYLSYDRSSDTAQFFVNASSVLGVSTSSILAYKPVSLPVYTFATLPGSPQTGWLAVITDCNTSTFNATAAGGGTDVVKVCYLNGAWKVA